MKIKLCSSQLSAQNIYTYRKSFKRMSEITVKYRIGSSNPRFDTSYLAPADCANRVLYESGVLGIPRAYGCSC